MNLGKFQNPPCKRDLVRLDIDFTFWISSSAAKSQCPGVAPDEDITMEIEGGIF